MLISNKKRNMFSLAAKAALIIGTINVLCVAAMSTYFSQSWSTQYGSIAWTTKIKVLEKDGAQVILVGMRHVAHESFYNKIQTKFKNTNVLVLAEGISDNAKIGSWGTDRGTPVGFEKIRGLTFQPSADKMFARYKFADIDISEYSPICRLKARINHGDRKVADLETKDFNFNCDQEVIIKRNKALLLKIEKSLLTESKIVIPWGLNHMPQLERDLVNRGFSVVKTETVIMDSFFHQAGSIASHYLESQDAILKTSGGARELASNKRQ